MPDSQVRILIKEEIDRINQLIYVNEQTVGGLTLLGGPSGAGIFDPLFAAKAYNWFSTFDKHDWASFIEITTGILGLIPSPASPFLLAISLGAGVTDAVFYFQEGDPYMGGLMLALAILPAAELIKAIPAAKPILQKGSTYARDLLKKVRSLSGKKGLSKAEKATIEEGKILIEGAAKNADELAKMTAKQTVKTIITGVVKAGGKVLWGTTLLLSKLAWAVGKPLVQIAGIYYTYDEIYLALYGSDQEKMKLRYNSRFQGLIRGLKVLTNLQSAEEQANEFLLMNSPKLEENPEKLASIDPIKQQEAINQNNEETARLLEEKQKQQKVSPSLNDVLAGKINPFTNQPYVIKKGQKGDSVKKIQDMLSNLKFGVVLSGYKDDVKGSDSIYGDNTLDAVLLFQSANNLNETGVVDSKTLSALIKKNKELKKNEK